MAVETKEHFKEEEIYWPPILKKYGPTNWDRAEALLVADGLSWGDENAGDPFRLLMCAVSDAMGCWNENEGWGSAERQKHFMTKRANFGIKSWHPRYLKLKKLITVCAGDTRPEDSKIVKNKATGRYVEGHFKRPVPLILFVFLSLYYSLAVGPYLAAVSDPAQNVENLHILVANFDNGQVGSAFIEWINDLQRSNKGIPTFDFVDPSTTSPDQLQRNVLNGQGWATLYVTAGSSDVLNSSLASGCASTDSYNAKNAIVLKWDEGRNSAVASGYIDGFLHTTLPQFTAEFSTNLISSLNSDNLNTCIANGKTALLVTPVSYTDMNLTPTNVSPLSSSALTVGSILVAVFNSLVFVNATYRGTAALFEDMTPMKRVLFRAACLSLLGSGMAICYATLVISLTYQGSSGHLYSGSAWAQIFAVQWVHSMIWSFFHAAVVEALSIFHIPFCFAFLLLSSVIGGWNTDVADIGYRNFYQIFPFKWSLNIIRYVLYGTLEYRLRISAGILIGEGGYEAVMTTCAVDAEVKKEKGVEEVMS
eukprot:gene29132-36125_t